MKHTKGNWTYKTDVNRADIVISSDDRGCVCKIDVPTHSLHTEMEANAKLIAAAPELLELAKEVHAICRLIQMGRSEGFDIPELEKLANNAIKKATK